MKKMKHVLSMLLAVSLTATLFTGCGGGGGDSADKPSNNTDKQGSDNKGGETGEDGLPALTDEKITLKYLNFDDDIVTKKLAEEFMELHPNITVQSEFVIVDDYNTTLLNLVSSNQTPDCFMFSDTDFALKNKLLYDMTDYWEADEENKNLLPTINELKLGYYFTDRKYGTPMKFFPGAFFVDLNCLETLNIEAPPKDWVWDDMIDLIKKATDETQSPAYYGLGAYNRLDSYYGIAAGQDVIGEFGFNGKSFNLALWAVGEQQFATLKQTHCVAPDKNTQQMETWLGSLDGWAGSSGRVAVMTEAYWSFKNIWDTPAYRRDMDMCFVPYVVPAVEEGEGVHNSIGTLDFGGISAGTKYPREAYELLKFMGWGKEGWSKRIELYKDPDIKNTSDAQLQRSSMPAPITMDQDIWDSYREMYPTKGGAPIDAVGEFADVKYDDREAEYWDTYFESCTRPIPFGWLQIPGYWAFCDGYFNKIGIHDLVDSGEKKAIDYADDATEQANQYFADAMNDYFGIDVTSDSYKFEKDTSGNSDAKLSFSK